MSSRHQTEQLSGSHSLHFLNFYTASAGIAPSRMDLHLRRGRALHSAAVRNGLAAVLRGLVTLARRAVEGHRRRRLERRTEQVLRSLSPLMLRDIGIEGHQIPAIARGLSLRAGDGSKPAAAASPVLECCLDRAA